MICEKNEHAIQMVVTEISKKLKLNLICYPKQKGQTTMAFFLDMAAAARYSFSHWPDENILSQHYCLCESCFWIQLNFQSNTENSCFDGIFACASLTYANALPSFRVWIMCLINLILYRGTFSRYNVILIALKKCLGVNVVAHGEQLFLLSFENDTRVVRCKRVKDTKVHATALKFIAVLT